MPGYSIVGATPQAGGSAPLPSGPAPDVQSFQAGNYDPVTGTFSPELQRDRLKESAVIDTLVVAPAATENFSGVRFVFRIPKADGFEFQYEGDPWTLAAFAPPAGGGEMAQTFGLDDSLLALAGQTIRIFAVSINARGKQNEDADGRPTGPFVDVVIPALEDIPVFDRPGRVTALDFTWVKVADAIGIYDVTATMNRPGGDDPAIGVQLYLEVPLGTKPRDVGVFDFIGAAAQSFTFRIEAPRGFTAPAWRLWAVTYSKNYNGPLVTTGPDAAPFVVKNVATMAVVDAALRIVDGVLGVSPGGISEDLIGTFSVSQSKLKDAAVVTSKIADGVITNTKLGDRSVTALKLGLLAVEAANIADAAVTTAKIQNLAVTNALIANLAVTDAKIGDVSANKITAGVITATVRMTSPEIEISSTVDGNPQLISIKAADSIKITSTTGTRFTQQTWSQFRVERTTDTTEFTNMTLGSFTTQRDGTSAALRSLGGGVAEVALTGTSARVLINGLAVVGPRQPAISAPTGGGTPDPEARLTIAFILAALRIHGLIAT